MRKVNPLRRKAVFVFVLMTSMTAGAFGKNVNGDTLVITFGDARNGYTASSLFFNDLVPQVNLVDKNGYILPDFKIISGIIISDSIKATGHILEDGFLSQDAFQLLEDVKTKKATTISVEVTYQNLTTLELGRATMKFYGSVLPMVQFGEIEMGDNATLEKVSAVKQVSIIFEQKPDLVEFTIIKGTVRVDGHPGVGKILEGGLLDESALSLLAESSGKQVTINVDYADPSGMARRTSFVFFVI